MILSRTNVVPVLTIWVGGAVGVLLALGFLVLLPSDDASGSDHPVVAPSATAESAHVRWKEQQRRPERDRLERLSPVSRRPRRGVAEPKARKTPGDSGDRSAQGSWSGPS